MAITRKSLSQIKKELKNLSAEDQLRLERVQQMKDDDIDYSDIPPLDSSWVTRINPSRSQPKKSTTLRIDAPVLEFYRKQGKGYQTFINHVLKEYAKHHGMKE